MKQPMLAVLDACAAVVEIHGLDGFRMTPHDGRSVAIYLFNRIPRSRTLISGPVHVLDIPRLFHLCEDDARIRQQVVMDLNRTMQGIIDE